MVGLTRPGDSQRGTAGQRVGVIGGTFDPIHLGHLVIADRVREALDLDRVLFVPAWLSPLKLDTTPASPEHREAMLRLAIADHQSFELSRVDLEREGPSYTVDTLELLTRRLGSGTELNFVLGADSLVDLPLWHAPDRLIQLARLAVVPRPGFSSDLDVLDRAIPGSKEAIRQVDAPLLEISATDLRRRVAERRSIRYLVPEAVRAYIQEHRLYVEHRTSSGR